MEWPLCQGQATRLLVHRPNQRAATRWGRDTSTPNALKTVHFKKHLQILTFRQHDMAQKCDIGASAKARRCAIRRVAWPSVQQVIGGGTLPPPMH